MAIPEKKVGGVTCRKPIKSWGRGSNVFQFGWGGGDGDSKEFQWGGEANEHILIGQFVQPSIYGTVMTCKCPL